MHRLLPLAFMFGIVACGSGAFAPAPVAPTPSSTVVAPPATPAPVPAVGRGSPLAFTGNVSSRSFTFQNVTIQDEGTLIVTLKWPDETRDLDLHVTDPNCASGSRCVIYASSEMTSGNQEQVQLDVHRNEEYRVWVYNSAAVVESYTLELVLR